VTRLASRSVPRIGLLAAALSAALPEPGHAVRLDFSIRARPNRF
jgi:hypothetical protein